MSVLKKALDNRQIILTLTFLILSFGVYSLLTMPRREDPKFNIRQGLVVAMYPGATAKEINEKVTSKIEDLLFSYQEVRKQKTYSNSRQGVMYIVVELESFVTDADLFWSKLQHRLNMMKLEGLPAGVVGPFVESDFGDTIALLIGFDSQQRDQREMEEYIDLLADRLREVRSLSKIKRIGQVEECFYINVDNQKMSQYKVYTPQIIAAINAENLTLGTGKLEQEGVSIDIVKPELFTTKADIENQIVGYTLEGEMLRVKDVATVERSVKEPSEYIRVDGIQSILVSLEMQNGFNIVDFGEEIQKTIDEFKKTIPPDIQITEVVNQPKNVSESINDFIREFFIAIVSVIIIILLLLPFRVALIAAAAIPVTVAFTFSIMNGVGIQLQQVSLASLIVVLGMLVDDAIVIADNYVEKLDEGMDNYNAAWQSASQLKVPMFTAGLTIVGAFAPLLLLSGYVGEFIQSLPITVAIAINASFIVAMFLTPYMCYKFIRKGLSAKVENSKKRKSFLDYLQVGFDKALDFSFRKPALILTLSVVMVVVGGVLFLFLKQKLFPAAERDQFVIEMRGREGTSLEQMNENTKKVESFLSKDDRLKNYAAFVGTSAPRFYYNYAQHFPQTNISQLLINTHSIKETDTWVKELEATLPHEFPHFDIFVKKMVQGPSMEAPVEIRISGYDVETLEKLADTVTSILSNKPLASHVVNDFYEKELSLKINTEKDVANQLGISNSNVSTQMAVAYSGIPAGTIWEAKTPIPVILRDESIKRNSIDAINDFYITSPLTGTSIPLNEFADIKPQWLNSNIRTRNGVKTVTVLSQAETGVLPVDILSSIKHNLKDIEMPNGYTISIGGEDENQRETFAEMSRVMLFSLFIIFIIMLVQFKRLNQVFIVLAAIPLSIFGASFGLLVSGYPFGFTAFVGLASLIGVSVRNSIILVDYANELMVKEGHNTREAAMLAGKRRIRPIFLTTMAAAIGVTPMIISGSPMWAPLATVLAVGLFFSMFMTLLTIPVLYWKYGAIRHNLSKSAVILVILGTLSVFGNNAQAQSLDMKTCFEKAKTCNLDLALLELELEKKQLEIDQVRSNYLPKVMLDGGYGWYYNSQRTTEVEIEINGLPLMGNVPPIGIGTELLIPQGNRLIGIANVGVYQPVTQIFKINSGVGVKQYEYDILKAKYNNAETKIEAGVAKLYMAMAIQDTMIVNLRKNLELIKTQKENITKAVSEGEVLDVFLIGLQADLMDHETQLSQAMIDRQSYQMQLNKLMDFPADTVWEGSPVFINRENIKMLLAQTQTDSALIGNSDILQAELTHKMAAKGVQYSQYNLLPEINLVAQGFYYENIPLVPKTNVFVGAMLTWPIVQWGKKNKEVAMAKIQANQAALKTELTEKDAVIELRTKMTELENSLRLLETAEKANEFRSEQIRIQTNAFQNGLISYNDFADVQKKHLETVNVLTKARANIIIKQYEVKSLMGYE